jgi:adenosylcobinamide-GDP ribazoletransferase
MRRLRAALAFLTRLPVTGDMVFDAADVGRGTLFFPVVGAALGVAEAVLIFALAPLGLPALVQAILATTAGALLTGGLHLDALADAADGLGGGRTREDVLRIMRDHVIGAYGAIALVLGLGLRVAALAALIERGAFLPWLVAGGALARWASPLLGRLLPYARDGGGLGAAVTDHVGATELGGATALALAIAALAVGRGLLPSLVVLAAITAVVAAVCRRRLGGVTGDTLGAHTELCELGVLVVGVARTAGGM